MIEIELNDRAEACLRFSWFCCLKPNDTHTHTELNPKVYKDKSFDA